ncbi:MAG: phytanoyl-CoA dioxygenase family protein [Planctomycetota bacterium]
MSSPSTTPVADTAYIAAPPGFTDEQWDTFMRDGFLVIEDAISPEDVERYLALHDAFIQRLNRRDPNGFFNAENLVEKDPAFVELIDHPRHIGFAYDCYGELTKLQQSQLMIRPRGGWHNFWHPDGPRGLPYNVFSPHLPLQVKFGYWLTDLPEPKMGNFVCLPGSHHQEYQDFYDTHDSVPGEKILTCKAGTMTLMHNALWHRVEPNESDVVRKNFFLTYSPAWITNQDRWHSDPSWLDTLTREQRILMRSYDWAYDWAKPKADQFPLYLDRDTGADRDPDAYPDHVVLGRRKRLTYHEKR